MSAAWIVLAVALGQAPPAIAPAPAQERLVEIVVHGNHTTTDADVAAAAGLTIGAPLAPEAVVEAKRRLEKTGRFDGIDIRKRYRSIASAEDVVLVIVIDERPHPLELPSPPVLRPITKLKNSTMFLPILSFTDGYGLSYGARFTFADVLGRARASHRAVDVGSRAPRGRGGRSQVPPRPAVARGRRRRPSAA